jgi:glycolate oxidase
MSDIIDEVLRIVGAPNVLVGDAITEGLTHDECLTVESVTPLAVALPATTAQVAAILRACNERRTPVTARGAATGLSGASTPTPDAIVVSFERMSQILEIDTANHVAVVQPGVTLAQLNEVLGPHGLVYPVFPGEASASLGGNVGTNAGGMRAVKYGVTRHHVLGLEAVLATGEVIRTGGKFVKSSTGYDLTQLIIGSEGTLALVTEVTVKLAPLLEHRATLLAPFPSLAQITRAVPAVVASGAAPLMLEYIDQLTMAAITEAAGVDLGVPEDVRNATAAYLVVVLEGLRRSRVDDDTEAVATLLDELGASDVFVLPAGAGEQLIRARERAFFVAKAAGANDLVDVVVPRASIADYLARANELASEYASFVSGCGHAGDGNVHLTVFQRDRGVRESLMRALVKAGIDLGGAITGEHGLGRAKARHFVELGDPTVLALMQRLKQSFDPNGILAPQNLPGLPGAGHDRGASGDRSAGGDRDADHRPDPQAAHDADLAVDDFDQGRAQGSAASSSSASSSAASSSAASSSAAPSSLQAAR